MKERVICFLVLALISSSTLMFGQDKILDYWDKKKVLPDSVICSGQALGSSIPENIVLDYLCNTRNDYFNPNSRYRLRYYPVCKAEALSLIHI